MIAYTLIINALLGGSVMASSFYGDDIQELDDTTDNLRTLNDFNPKFFWDRPQRGK